MNSEDWLNLGRDVRDVQYDPFGNLENLENLEKLVNSSVIYELFKFSARNGSQK